MRKKLATMLLAGTAVVVCLAGCGNKTEGGITPTPTTAAQQTEAPKETSTPAPTVTPTEAPAVTDDISETKITLCEYKGLTLYEVDSSVIAEELRNVMKEYAELVVVNRAAVEGDTVNINYVGKKDGVAFDGGTDDSEAGTNLELGSGQFIDGFEEGLIGAVAGEVRDLNLTFPEQYHSAELAGQSVVFTVTVNSVMESVIPELTDEFAKENLPFDTVGGYVAALYEVRNKESFKEQLLNHLVENCKIENYPAGVIEYEKQSLIDYYVSYAEYLAPYLGGDTETALQNMFGFASMEALESYAQEYAYSMVTQMLILSEIAAKENLTVSDEEYQQRALVYAINNGYEDVAAFEAEVEKEAIIEAITLDYVVDYIISQANIVAAENDADIQQKQPE